MHRPRTLAQSIDSVTQRTLTATVLASERSGPPEFVRIHVLCGVDGNDMTDDSS